MDTWAAHIVAIINNAAMNIGVLGNIHMLLLIASVLFISSYIKRKFSQSLDLKKGQSAVCIPSRFWKL